MDVPPGETPPASVTPTAPQPVVPLLSYSLQPVRRQVNPPAIAGLIWSIMVPGLVALAIRADLELSNLALPFLLTVGGIGLVLGMFGWWLARDRKVSVAGRRFAAIAVLVNLVYLGVGGLLGMQWVASYIANPPPPAPVVLPPNDAACRANIQKLHAAILAYARKHQGMLPSSLLQVSTAEDGSSIDIACPDTGTRYRFPAAGRVLWSLKPQEVLLFEKPAGHNVPNQAAGCHVVQTDGTIRFVFSDHEIADLDGRRRRTRPRATSDSVLPPHL